MEGGQHDAVPVAGGRRGAAPLRPGRRRASRRRRAGPTPGRGRPRRSRFGTRALSRAACTTASWALVRVSTAMLDHGRPGVRDSLARAATQAASSSSRGVRHDLGDRPVHPGRAGQDHLARRPERAALPQDGGRHRDHLGRAAVVLVQPDDRGAAQNVGQPVEQGRVGAVEPVDRLVGVAHDEEVGLVGQHGGQQPELGRVDVLHLVDEQVPGAPADGVGELGVARQRVGAGHDEVVEVEEAPAGALRLVAGERVRHLLGADAAAATVPARASASYCSGETRRALAQPISPSRARVRRASPVVTSASRRRRSGRSWGRGRPRSSPVFAQQAERGAVEGAGLHPGDPQRVEAGAQLVRRLAAERRDQGAVGLDGPVTHPPGHPQGEDPRLAGAGPRHDAEQRLVRLDGLTLGHGEAVGAREACPRCRSPSPRTS